MYNILFKMIFDDINYLELHNEELDEMINRYYNDIQNIVIDKYNLSKELYAIIQFQKERGGERQCRFHRHFWMSLPQETQ